MSVRWIATAATIGPSAITIWVAAFVFFYLPLLAAVLELSSRFEGGDGGIYDWSKQALGRWSGFMTGWTYWTSNLPYFPALLLFAADAASHLISKDPSALAADRAYVLTFSLVALWLATFLNVIGLRFGKWLFNLGAVGNWGPVAILIVLAAAASGRFGSASSFTLHSLVPTVNFQQAIFWSSIVFAVAGSEASAFLRHEVADAPRVYPRALLLAGAFIAVGYIGGTVAILVILPVIQLSGLGGIMDAIVAGSARLGWSGLAPLIAMLLVASNVGQVGTWLAATARLPFVAGIDRYLPAAFGRMHPRFGTPHHAFIWQSLLATVFIVISQAGTTVALAYNILIGMGIISYFLPYLFTFASVIRMQSVPAGAEVIRPPGGRVTATILAAIGFTVVLIGIVLACFPAEGETNKPLAVFKVVGSMVLLVAVGQFIYWNGTRKMRRAEGTEER
jgi:amino acid transporter